MNDPVRVQGLRELQAGLRRVNPNLPRELGRAHRRIADELVAQPARRLAAQLGGGHVRLTRPAAISARGTARSAAIALNAGRTPDVFGWEFGAKRWRQFPAWRGNQWNPDADQGPGYVVYPTIRQARPRIIAEYADRVMAAFAPAFPEVR